MVEDFSKYTRKYLDSLDDDPDDYEPKPKRKPRRKKEMGEFTKYVLYSIVGAVIFLLIYSIWFNPSSVSNAWENTKDKVIDTAEAYVASSQAQSSQVQAKKDTSVSDCLNDLKRSLKIQEEKAVVKTTFDIKEYTRFDNNQDALDYLSEWGFNQHSLGIYSDSYMGSMNTNNWLENENNDIIIILIKRKMSMGGDTLSLLYPSLCLDGDFKI